MGISASVLGEAFPAVNPGVRPFGEKVLVQLRMVRKRTAGGIVLAEETRDYNRDACLLGKVVALGPIAFHNRDTGEPWKEGTWCKPGDYVRVIKYGGDRFKRKLNEDDFVEFVIMKDHEVNAGVDPEAFEDLDEIK